MSVSFTRSGGLLAVLRTDKDFYLPGEPVRMFFSVTNLSPVSFTLVFPTTQRYDFSVAGAAGEVWRWSHDKLFALVTEGVVLRPGAHLAYYEVWPQVDNNGFRVMPGLYMITARSTFRGSETLPWPSTWIRIGV